MEQKKHWYQIDCLYAIGIILVLIGHSHSSDWSSFEGTILQKAIPFIYMFHMPLFFLVAGFLFQNSGSLEKHGYCRWISEKALRLLVPYLFWTLAALVPKYYLEHHGFGGLTPLYVLRTVFVPRDNIWGHFWFIPVMFLTYALFGALRVLTKRWDAKGRATALLALVICTGIWFLPLRVELFGLTDLKKNLVFFPLGMTVRMFYPNSSQNNSILRKTILALCVVLLTAGAVFLWRMSDNAGVLLCISLLMLFACWLFSELIPSHRAIRWFAGHNFTIYIFSWLFQAGIMTICDKLDTSWIITFACMFTIGFAAPILLALLLDRIPLKKNRLFCLIFGVRTKTGNPLKEILHHDQ